MEGLIQYSVALWVNQQDSRDKSAAVYKYVPESSVPVGMREISHCLTA